MGDLLDVDVPNALVRVGRLLPARVAYVDRRFVIRFMSPMAAASLGKTPDEVEGRTMSEVLGREAFELRLPAMERALAGEVVVREGGIGGVDSREEQLRSTYVPDVGPRGIAGILVLAEDLSAVRASELQVARLARDLERAQAAGGVGLWLSEGSQIDRVQCSPEMLRIFGIESFDGRAETLIRAVHPDDHAVLAEAQARAREGHRYSAEHRIVRPDGEVRWVSVEADVQIEVDGSIRNFGTTQDITERKKAELLLRESELRYKQFLETANEGIWALDPAFCVTFANRRLAEMLGVEPDAIVGRPAKTFFLPEDDTAHRDWFERRKRGAAERFETTLLRPDGGRVPVLVSTSPLTTGAGEFGGSIAMISDQRERKDLEDRLRQAQKMEAVGRLAGGIAHDFNNLLSVILSFNALAQGDLPDEHEVLEHLSEVQKAGERAAELTKQLLAFSRKQLLKPRVLEPNALLRQQAAMIRRLIAEDIELSLVLNARGHIKVDPGQLEQVIANLVVNARDAMQDGGNLTIATRDVDLGGDRAHELDLAPGPFVMISVTDTGSGMDDETLAKAFEPFFTTKGQGKGTGLGLSTVFGIVKQSGGAVEAESQLGGGSAITLYLPRSPDSVAPTTGRGKVLAARASGETILVVEDDAQLRALCARVLTRQGYDVLEAGDPLVALELVKQLSRPLHLLLTDVVMPHMNGRQLADKVLSQHPKTRVLFMSGYTQDSIVHRGVIEPGLSFMPKPITPEVLLANVRRVLDA